MKKITLILAALSLSSAALYGQSAKTRANLLFSAKLSGAQEVPPVSTTASGVASVYLSANRDTAMIMVTATGLSGTITGAHIHQGPIGIAGSVVTDLNPGLKGNTISMLLTGSGISKPWLRNLINGQFYVNVHTAANPGGEIRGQLMLESDKSFTAWVTGGEEVPVVNTNGYGLVIFNMDQDSNRLSYKGVFYGLSSAVTGIHLHTGAAGKNGPVILNLASSFVDGVLNGVSSATNTLIDSLMHGRIYFNIHTADNPGGELRGQLVADNHLAFDAHLTAAGTGNPVTETGLASVKMNGSFDTIWYKVATDLNVGDTIIGQHFHHSGGTIDLQGLNGNMVNGMLTGSAISNAFIRELLEGRIYVAFHSDTFPAVKIKGDVLPLKREPYVLHMNASNETGTVNSTATGTGMVSLNRDNSGAHVMYTYHNLSGPAVGMHLHKAPRGVSGPVIRDLMPFHTANGNGGTVDGYWSSSDLVAFGPASTSLFRNDSVYVNVHTTAYPAGEIRGQASTTMAFEANIAAVRMPGIKDIAITPNPAGDKIEVTLAGKIQVRLYSTGGQLLLTSDSNQIDISGLNPGIYLLRINSESGVYATQLIKY